jgi:PhnB protein
MATKKKASTPSQHLTPYLLYRDVGKALVWLEKAFGFKEFGDRFEGKDGKVQHAAMRISKDGETLMMGSPGPKYKNPKQLGAATQFLYINVDNVDKHFARAKKAGAKITEKPQDTFYGDRRYTAVDPEGHQWSFAQHVRDVSAAEMKKAMKA